ncbi:Hypothetical predicted protein, partial [Paramuricea clavata]
VIMASHTSSTGWNVMPGSTDNSREANIVQVSKWLNDDKSSNIRAFIISGQAGMAIFKHSRSRMNKFCRRVLISCSYPFSTFYLDSWIFSSNEITNGVFSCGKASQSFGATTLQVSAGLLQCIIIWEDTAFDLITKKS